MRRVIIFVALLLLCSSFVSASSCPPSLPKTYLGEISYGGNPLAGDYEIRAVMGSDTVGIAEVSEGTYEIDISPCVGTTGIVYFYINGIGTNEKGNYIGMDDWGINEDLDLTTIDEPPIGNTCGDEAIQLGEECDGINFGAITDCGDGWTGTISCSASCQIDYSNCVIEVVDSVSRTSSGGGGGSSSSSNDEGVIVLDEQADEETEVIDEPEVLGEQTSGTGLGAIIGFAKSVEGLGLVFGLIILAGGIFVFIIQKKKGKSNEKILDSSIGDTSD